MRARRQESVECRPASVILRSLWQPGDSPGVERVHCASYPESAAIHQFAEHRSRRADLADHVLDVDLDGVVDEITGLTSRLFDRWPNHREERGQMALGLPLLGGGRYGAALLMTHDDEQGRVQMQRGIFDA